MSRKWKILRNILIGLAGLLALLLLATVLIIPTDWFRNFVRQKIISATEQGTGGRVELASFYFDEWKLQAVVTGFVIHGKEPPAAAPFVRIARAELDLRLFPGPGRLLDITWLRVKHPEVNVITFADGSTNIPTPPEKSTSNKTTLETVVDLAVGHFELTDGLLSLAARPQSLNIRGSNLRAQLVWNTVMQGYQGQIGMQPVYVVSGRNTPVHLQLTLPVSIQRDRIEVKNASITTPVSKISINGSVANMRDPRLDAHLNGYVATADLESLSNLKTRPAAAIPSRIDLDANATLTSDSIQVTGFRAGFGRSSLEASGTLKDPRGSGSLAFRSEIALDELGRLFHVSAKPAGLVELNGNASLDAANNYRITGNVEARQVSFQQGGRRISNVNVASAVQADSHELRLNGLRLNALGAELLANVSLQDFRRYTVEGRLRALDVRRVLREFDTSTPYDGVVSGSISASGDTAAPGTSGLSARVRLAITPGGQGTPVTGRLNASYEGAHDSLTLADSFLALPHTRLTLNGSLNRQLNVALTSRDLRDLTSALSPDKPPVDVALASELRLTGVVSGSLTTPRFEGHLSTGRFSVEGRRFDSLAADFAVSDSNAAVRNGHLARDTMQTQFAGTVGLRHWKALPPEPVSADLTVQNGDLADAVVLAGGKPAGYAGTLSAAAHVQGTIGNPRGKIDVQSSSGTLNGVAFDRAEAQLLLTEQLATLPSAFIQSGSGRVDLTGEFRHPADSFTTGHVHAHLQTSQIDLAQLRVTGQKPAASGSVHVTADVNGDLARSAAAPKRQDGNAATEFLLTSVNADVAARGVTYEGQHYGDVTASAQTSGRNVQYTANSNFAGSAIRLNGTTQLTRDYPTTANADVSNLAVERLLTVAQRADIRARGVLSGSAQLHGTLADPQGSAEVSLAHGVIYDEPLDRVRARVTYGARTVAVPELEITAGPARIEASARYDHPEGNFSQGAMQITVRSNQLNLARIHTVQTSRSGLGGVLQINASAAASVSEKEPRLQFSRLDADIEANGISAQGKNFGNLKLTANTGQGGRVNLALASNLAGASLRGQGSALLSGDFPFEGRVTFSNVTYSRLRELLGPSSGQTAGFEGVADGQIDLQGPARKTDQLHGGVQITRLALTAPPRPGAAPVAITNQGPLAATIDRGVIHIQSAHLTDRQTDIQVRGSASLPAQTLDLTANASIDLGILPSFDSDIYSSGKIVVATTLGGQMSRPVINGQLTLQNATVNYTGLPNGISNANGVISFNGTNATIASLTAESGGGKLSLTGFVGYADVVRFGLAAKAARVRVRVQQGVSIIAGADLRLDGTSQNSTLSGTVTIQQLNYAPQSDIGSLLSTASTPVQAPSAPSPVLDNMRLNIRVRTAAGLAVQASLAENLQANADLTVRGTASHPGILGRVTVSQGQLVFFGSSYTISSGSIAFYNPTRIEPILDISLETQARGVNVVLRVTGPVDNMNLSYTSDPPLQFQEIVALLAAGSTPTSDPTLLANQPQTPQQSFQQRGESALLSKALTDPVSGRLQRVFGVTQLKIDPSFTTGSQIPTARLTFQQRITNNLTFTYTSALDDPNGQIIKVEWALTPRWSAVATRDQNGIFSVNFFYRKQFR